MVKKKKESWKDQTGLRKEMKIRKLILESQKHDRNKCRCEGCYWWAMTVTITKGFRFFQIIPKWKDLDRDEYLRIMQLTMRYKLDKKMTKGKLVKYLMSEGASRGLTKEQAEKMVEKMLEPIHMVMYGDASSPLGILRDI